MNIHSVIACSRVNGPGRRMVVFFQGCKRRCPGCFNPQTHPLREEKLLTPLEVFRRHLEEGIEGITISGGEPFLQIEGLRDLLSLAKEEYGLTTMVYTGYRYEELSGMASAEKVFRHIDVLVDGEFDITRKEPTLLARGSTNQRFLFLSPAYTIDDLCMEGRTELIINEDGDVVTTGFSSIPQRRSHNKMDRTDSMLWNKKLKITKDFLQDSDVVLYTGDALDFLRQIPDKTASLVITSPPYNIGKPYEKKLELDEYMEQQEEIIEESVRITKDDGSICWQVGNYVENGSIIPLDILLYPIFTKLGLKLRNRIVWHFGHGLHARKRFSGRYEVIMWFTKSEHYMFNLDAVRIPQKYPNKKYFKGSKKGELSCHPLGKNPTDVWEIPNVKANHPEKTIHPCQFPVELVERLVLALTNRGDWVIDPFVGVGSTTIASILHGRKSAGADIIEEYIEIGRQRIESLLRGRLRLRPMGKPIYTPATVSIHPNADLFESVMRKQR